MLLDKCRLQIGDALVGGTVILRILDHLRRLFIFAAQKREARSEIDTGSTGEAMHPPDCEDRSGTHGCYDILGGSHWSSVSDAPPKLRLR